LNRFSMPLLFFLISAPTPWILRLGLLIMPQSS
jgi:hypothetical protein